MKVFVGKRVKIKSIEWFNENEDGNLRVVLDGISIWRNMAEQYCSKIYKITSIDDTKIYLENIPYVWSKKAFDEEFDKQEYPEIKYKVGDKVKVKPIEWYNCYANLEGSIVCGSNTFIREMNQYCSCYLTIKTVDNWNCQYTVKENSYTWTDEMLNVDSLIINNKSINKYKIGDRVKVKSKEWYYANCNDEIVDCIDNNGKVMSFIEEMSSYCSNYLTISNILSNNRYETKENNFFWCDSMFEDVVESALKDVIIIPEFNIGDVVITADKKVILTIKKPHLLSNDCYYVNENNNIYYDYQLQKIGEIISKNNTYKFNLKFNIGDSIRVLNNIEIENLVDFDKNLITTKISQNNINIPLIIEYIFYDLTKQIKYKIFGINEVWSGWMLKPIDIINTSDEVVNKITSKINILPNNKTKLNIKISPEVKIQLKPKKPIKYESCSSS